MRPDVGIGRNHAFKRKHASSVVFVCNTNPDSVFFRLSFFKNTVSKLRVICTAQFVDIKKNYAVSNAVIIKVINIADNIIIASYNIVQT